MFRLPLARSSLAFTGRTMAINQVIWVVAVRKILPAYYDGMSRTELGVINMLTLLRKPWETQTHAHPHYIVH